MSGNFTGKLVGFCNLGQVNEDLERLSESLCTGSVVCMHTQAS